MNNIVWHNNSFWFDGDAVDPETGAIVGDIVEQRLLGLRRRKAAPRPGPHAGDLLRIHRRRPAVRVGLRQRHPGGDGDRRRRQQHQHPLHALPGWRIHQRRSDESDYHITADVCRLSTPGGDVSSVPSMPDLTVLLTKDYDDGPRPGAVTTPVDIGADEEACRGADRCGRRTSGRLPEQPGSLCRSPSARSPERQLLPARADYNTDGDVDAVDLGLFSSGFGAHGLHRDINQRDKPLRSAGLDPPAGRRTHKIL